MLNASEISGIAGSVGGYLQEQGYTVVETSNAQPGVYSASQILTTAGHEADPDVTALAELLGGLPITTTTGLAEGEVAVIVAADYEGPQSTTQASTSAEPEVVGQEGSALSPDQMSPTITAAGSGPRCVN